MREVGRSERLNRSEVDVDAMTMANALDEQLAHLVELHGSGGLTDAEFAQTKAATPAVPPSATPAAAEATDDAPVVMTLGEAFAKFPSGWMIFCAVVLGVISSGVLAILEVEAVQTVAAPVVCLGGELQTGYDVSYAVAVKGVSDAASCVRVGVASPVPSWLMFVVLGVLWEIPFLLLLYLAEVINRRKQARRWGVRRAVAG